jgi:hypothetical protein
MQTAIEIPIVVEDAINDGLEITRLSCGLLSHDGRSELSLADLESAGGRHQSSSDKTGGMRMRELLLTMFPVTRCGRRVVIC